MPNGLVTYNVRLIKNVVCDMKAYMQHNCQLVEMAPKSSTKVMPSIEGCHLTTCESDREGTIHAKTSNIKSLTSDSHVCVTKSSMPMVGQDHWDGNKEVWEVADYALPMMHFTHECNKLAKECMK